MSKQLKINECKRVVNVDDILKLAQQLKDPLNDENRIIDALNKLENKTPSKEILFKSRLGFILKDIQQNKQLSKHIRDKAKQIRTKWKEFHKNLLLAQRLDVKCDKPTTQQRDSSKTRLENIILSNLNTQNDSSIIFKCKSLVYELEFLIFQICSNLINQKYYDIISKLSLHLENNKQDCEAFIINNTLLSKDLFNKINK
jgi:predicted nuclease with TOPRIM domain